jgi:hypothetical protein
LISSIAIFSVSTRVDSEIAIVPEREWRIPTVTVSSKLPEESDPPQAVTVTAKEAVAKPAKMRFESFMNY